MRPAGPPSLDRWFDEHYALWTVHLSDVVADGVREVWIDNGRFAGSARITGGFYLKPIREVVVGPVHVDARSGSRVTLGTQLPIAAASGTFEVTIDRFDPRAIAGKEIFRRVSATTDLQGRLADPATWPLSLPVQVSTELDVRRFRVKIDRGLVRPGTRLEVGSERAVVSKAKVIGRAAVDGLAEVNSSGAGDCLRASVDLANVSIVSAEGAGILRAPHALVSTDACALDLARAPLSDARSVFEIAEGELPDASVFNAYLPRHLPFRIVSGGVRTKARVDITWAEHRASGTTSLRAHALDVRVGKFRVDMGTVHLDATLPRVDLQESGFVARGHAGATMTGIDLRTKHLALRGDGAIDLDVARWDTKTGTMDLGPSRVAITNVRGRVGGLNPSDLTAANIEVAAHGRALAVARPSLRSVDARLGLQDAVLSDARALQFLIPARWGLRVTSGGARAFGDVALSSSTHAATGTLEVDIVRGGVAVGETTLAGDFAARAAIAGFDPETSTFDLSGSSVTMREVDLAGSAADTRHWHGRAVLEHGTLRLEGPESDAPRLDGVVRLDGVDARPLLGLLLRDSLPRLAVGLVKMPRLTAYARLELAPNVALISDISASGGDVAIRGSYGFFGEDRRGAFIVEKGPFSVGVRLDKDGASPRFFNLDAWLGAHQHTARAKAAATPKGGPTSAWRRRGEIGAGAQQHGRNIRANHATSISWHAEGHVQRRAGAVRSIRRVDARGVPWRVRHRGNTRARGHRSSARYARNPCRDLARALRSRRRDLRRRERCAGIALAHQRSARCRTHRRRQRPCVLSNARR
jgi:hypothetical protein